MIGIDLVEVERIEETINKNEKFLNKVFTSNELEYLNNFKVDKFCHMAGFFATKEAVMKALVDCKKISFLDIEVCHGENGRPYVKLYKEAKRVFDAGQFNGVEISISQTRNYATAICQLSKR